MHAIPGASTQRIVGLHGGRLKITVNAQPERGRANKALVEFLADALNLRKSQISVYRGENRQQKEILIVGVPQLTVIQRLEKYLG